MAARDPKSYYPVFLDLTGRLAVVVGGGHAAERKIAQLVRYGADVTLITFGATRKMRQLEAGGLITIEPRGYIRGDLDGAFLVVCAETGEIASAVYAEAESRGCLVNVLGNPALSSFIVPSNVQRGPLQIAISTGGAAPAVAKQLRKQLQEQFGPEWATYVTLLGEIRALAFSRLTDVDARNRIIAAVADNDLLDRIVEGEELSAETVYAEFVAADEAALAMAPDDAAATAEAAAAASTEAAASAAAEAAATADAEAETPASAPAEPEASA